MAISPSPQVPDLGFRNRESGHSGITQQSPRPLSVTTIRGTSSPVASSARSSTSGRPCSASAVSMAP